MPEGVGTRTGSVRVGAEVVGAEKEGAEVSGPLALVLRVPGKVIMGSFGFQQFILI